ncbi:vomeronasal type-2 receptor 1-like [Discoglossus pictus]
MPSKMKARDKRAEILKTPNIFSPRSKGANTSNTEKETHLNEGANRSPEKASQTVSTGSSFSDEEDILTCSKMRELFQNFQTRLVADLTKTITENTQLIKEVKERVDSIEKVCDKLISDNNSLLIYTTTLENKLEDLQLKMTSIEDRSRINNLRLRGISETIPENNLKTYVEDLLGKLVPNTSKSENTIDSIHRLPLARHLHKSLPRDVILRLYSRSYKETIGLIMLCGDINLVTNVLMDKQRSYKVKSETHISKAASEFSSLIKSYELLDSWRVFHPDQKEFTFFSNRYQSYSRIDYIFADASTVRMIEHSEIILAPWISQLLLNILLTSAILGINLGKCWEPNPNCHLSGSDINGYLSQPGDLIIGGTFPIHVDRLYSEILFTSKPEDLKCQTFEFQNYQSMQALIFAVDEINANPDLLPNITLGFQIFDTCTVLRRAAEGTLWMLSGGQESVPNYSCYKGGPLAGVIGDSGSTRSILMAQIFGLYRCPQISYFSTSPLLSNRNQFPSFFRTIPSDEFQSRGLAQLVSHFGWTWVGLLATDNDYGLHGIQVVKQEIVRAGACVAFTENILTGQHNRNAPHIVQVIRQSTAKIVVVLSSDSDFMPIVEELLRQNVTGRTLVASESWSTSSLLTKEEFQGILVGTIGFAIHGGQMPGFINYLNNMDPTKYLNDLFIKEYWEQMFSCKWFNRESLASWMENTTNKACTGREKLEISMTEVDFRITLNVYASVYAFSWALQSLIQCKPGSGPFHHGNCANISSFHPWQLLHYIKNVNFVTKDGTHVFFDSKGDPPALYDIVNWHRSSTGTLEQVIVGSYDSSASDGQTLKLNNSAITWGIGKIQVPVSKCSPSCPFGFRKVTLPGKPSCCYECIPCPQGEISNHTDTTECLQCSWDTWPNLQQDTCLPKTIEFLSYQEPLGVNLVAIALSSSTIPLGILGVFICYRTTPIVRANNRYLSCLLLVSLSLCFLCSLVFIAYPQHETCLFRQVAFGIIFALCISCVLAKTITVVVAFKATKPGSSLKKWTGIRVSFSVIAVCVLIQLFVCVMWLSLCPPFLELDTQTQAGVMIISCNEGSPTAFWCMLGFLGLLATLSFIVAFLARQLPDSFNEAKFITFSMLAFLIVWISFVPAYLSARGKYTVAMEVFAILTSSWAVVICIFLPKCFIIIFKPHMNSRQLILRSNVIMKR